MIKVVSRVTDFMVNKLVRAISLFTYRGKHNNTWYGKFNALYKKKKTIEKDYTYIVYRFVPSININLFK